MTESNGALFPDVPQTPSILVRTPSSVILGWEVPATFANPATPPLNRYRITYVADGENSPVVELITSGFTLGQSFNYTVDSLLAAQLYHVQLQAGNANGFGYEANFTISTVAGVPGAPGAPTVESFTNAAITLTSTAARGNGDTVTQYTTEVCNAGTNVKAAVEAGPNGSPSPCITLPASSAFATANGSVSLTIGTGGQTVGEAWWAAGTAFQVRMRGVNSLGDGAWRA